MLANRRIQLSLLCLAVLGSVPAFSMPASWPERFPVNAHLEIGPVAGLTTSWHPAPVQITVPVDADVELRVRHTAGATISWLGAKEVSNDGTWSIARPIASRQHEQRVTVQVSTQNGFVGETDFEESLLISRSPISSDQISVTPARVRVAPVEIAKDRVNESTYHYFRGESIASLLSVAPDRYRTSTQRTLQVQTDVDPPEFAQLIEWRRPDGTASLGNPARFSLGQPGTHRVSFGPVDSDRIFVVEAYSTEITSHAMGDTVRDGVWTIFRARTEPPGYESEITWLSSTSFGWAEPILHQGAEFKVRFDETFGANGTQWLGVKANGATFNQDANSVEVESCTPDDGEAGTVVTISGDGFGFDPDDLCVVLMPESKVAARVFASSDNSLSATVGGVVDGAGPGQWMVVRGEGGTAPIPDSAEIGGTPDAWAFAGVADPAFEDQCTEVFTPLATTTTDRVVGFDFIPCNDCFPECVDVEGSLEAVVPDDACPPDAGYPVGTEIDIDVHFDVRCDPPACTQTHFDCFASTLTVLQHLDAADVARDLADKLEQCFANQGITDIFAMNAGNRIVVFKNGCEMFQGGGSIVIRPPMGC